MVLTQSAVYHVTLHGALIQVLCSPIFINYLEALHGSQKNLMLVLSRLAVTDLKICLLDLKEKKV